MKHKFMIAVCGLTGVCFGAPALLFSQAGPGPIVVSPSSLPSAPAPPARPLAPMPKPREVAPRTSLAGAWRFNRDESDDPNSKARDTTPTGNIGGYPGGGYPGGGCPGGGYPGGGYPPRRYPGGGYPGGGYPGGGYPGGGYPGGGCPGGAGSPDYANEQKIQELIRPANTLSFAIRPSDIETTDEHFDKIDFLIDGRQPPKKQDINNRQIAAQWDGHILVSDEKSPLGGKMSRTFELSSDGRQFYETWRIERGRSAAPLVVRYVYDANDPQSGDRGDRVSDTGRPTLMRQGSGGDATTGGPEPPAPAPDSQTSDSDRPVLRRSTN